MNHKKVLTLILISLMLFSISPVSAEIPTTTDSEINAGESYTINYLNETDPTNITAYYLLVTTSKSNESENLTLAQVTGGNYSVKVSTTYQKTATQGDTKVGVDYGDTITHTLDMNATETVDVIVYGRFTQLGTLLDDVGQLFRSPFVRVAIAIVTLVIVFTILGFIVGVFGKVEDMIGKVGK